MTSKSKSTYIKIISVLTFVCVALSVMTVRYALKANRYRIEAEIASQRAMNELCESLDSITVSLQKSQYASTGKALSKIGNDLTRQASTAKMSLSELTDGDIITDEIYKFLSQIGEYTLSLCDENEITAKKESLEALSELYEYSQTLRDGFEDIRDSYFDGNVTLEQVSTNIMQDTQVPDTLLSKMQDAQQTLGDYPTLIYDGPFADNVLNMKGGESLEGEREITKAQAKKIAAEILGRKSESLKQEEDVASAIPLYCFSSGDAYVGITKKGGKLCYLVSAYDSGEETISEKEAVERGKEYLENLGYTGMRESYYAVYDGVCTINFAYTDKNVICYSDLIKVSVSLDKGIAVGLDASGYLRNHRERSFKQGRITQKQARDALTDSLEIIDTKTAMIPLDTGKEALCYEFRCKAADGTEMMVYIDKQTGEEQNLLVLLYGDGGTVVK